MTPHSEALFQMARRQFRERQVEQAGATLTTILQLAPGHAGAHLLLSQIEHRAGRYRAAHAHVLATMQDTFADAELEFERFQSLRTFNEHARMIDSAERLLAMKPIEIGRQMQLASSLSAIGAAELAEQVLTRMQKREPRHLATLLTEGYLATSRGEFERAERALEAALAREPRTALAHWLLARLRTQDAASNHVDRLRRVLSDRSLTAPDRAQIGFALHKELHDLGDFAAAWDVLAVACEQKRALTPYDEPATMRLFDAIEQASFGPTATYTSPGQAVPIFIVGMHRSGTTLLERMLGRHPNVVDCGETYRFTAQLREASNHHCKGVIDARVVAESARFDLGGIASGYLDSCRWRWQEGITHFTEKLPSNFLLLGWIKRTMPRARILHMRRDPMDTCLSNLRELFSDACAYSYDQGELGRYFRRYERLMAHWHRQFHGEILDVRYEDLVANPEAESRRVLDYCGLSWRDDVVDVAGHNGAVTTASAVQVRSPIHRRSIGGWRAYEDRLAPLRAILAP